MTIAKTVVFNVGIIWEIMSEYAIIETLLRQILAEQKWSNKIAEANSKHADVGIVLNRD